MSYREFTYHIVEEFIFPSIVWVILFLVAWAIVVMVYNFYFGED